jgi:hypothetical protein
MHETLPDFIGFVGVLITLGAYLLLQLSFLKINDIAYSLLNALGSLMILYSLFFHWNLSCVIIETVWFGISLFGALKILFKKKQAPLAD